MTIQQIIDGAQSLTCCIPHGLQQSARIFLLNQIEFAGGIDGGSVVVLVCPADDSPSQESNQINEAFRCGSSTDNRRTGMAKWEDGGTPRTICKLAFEISDIEGDVSAKNFHAQIYTMTTGNLGVLQATSAALTGVVATGWLVFNFPTPFTTVPGTLYALIFGQEAADPANYVWVIAGDTDLIPGYRELFSDAGAGNFGNGTTDQSIRIYWLP